MNFNSELYFLGNLCKRNHNYENSGRTLRLISTGHCLECQKLYYQRNKNKYKDSHKRNYDKNDPRRKISIRKYQAKKLYGLNWDQYVYMWEQQNHKCKICNTEIPLIGKVTCIDHDHQTGIVRGLLCMKCNNKLGVVEDTNFVYKAIAYLRNILYTYKEKED